MPRALTLLAVCLTGVASMVTPSLASAADLQREVSTIAEARAQPLGTVVTVRGSVTVPPGVFRSGTFDEGFAIQDRTGGIYVSVPTNLGFRVGQRVRVTGTLADSFGLLILVADAENVRGHGHGHRVRPLSLPTSLIGEASEGRLVRVTGTITQPVVDDLPFGYRVFVDDGSGEVQAFVYASTGIDVGDLRPGQRLRVTGFSGQFEDHYEINPRFPGDLVTLP
jgi:DNA/RNA endonuclease YhcR with UshA esterase domain